MSQAPTPPSGSPTPTNSPSSAIELRFAESGDAYQRAKVVADRMGLSVRDYLLKCIAEGHLVLAARTADQADLERPAFERRRSIQTDIDVDEELRKLREQATKGMDPP